MKRNLRLAVAAGTIVAVIAVVIVAVGLRSSSSFEEPNVADTSPPPPKGAPLEIAFIYITTALDGSMRYRMDRSDEWCAKPPTRQPWRREGRPIWLYAENGIARATAGNPVTGTGSDGRAADCDVDAEVKDVHSKRKYFFAAPHGHARILANTQKRIEEGECRGEIETTIDLNGDGRVIAIVATPADRIFCELHNGVWKRH